MANPFVHIELQTSDLAKAKSFYARLFDWKLEDVKMADGEAYTLIGVGQGTGGGMVEVKDAPPRWLAYVDVSDVAATTRKAQELGAKVVMEKSPVGDIGFMSVLVDPAGAVFALWEQRK